LKSIRTWSLKHPRIRRVLYFFPFQLFLVQLKKNHLLILYWLLLFGLVTKSVSAKYGIPYLFLNPEYLNEVNFLSYFIVGFSMGGFIMAFNISSYIMNAFRFPFLATLSNPFLKYCLNNLIIPLLFIIVYSWQVYHFQVKEQYIEPLEAFLQVSGLWLGISLFIFLSLTYFFRTNKDLFKMFNVETVERHEAKRSISRVILKDNLSWKTLNISDRDWHIETYIANPIRIRIARSYAHYDKDMLLKVFKQNHTNAAIFEIVVVFSLVLLGFFRETPVFGLPAGASFLLILTMYLMLTSAIYNWLRGWSTTVFFILFLFINAAFAWKLFYVESAAYGLNYNNKAPVYAGEELRQQSKDKNLFNQDFQNTLELLDKWRLKNTRNSMQRSSKPKFVLITASGGGLRSSLWTFYALQYADSLTNGELLNHTALITGASGGMVGAAYLRELYWQKQNKKIIDFHSVDYISNISKDLLNPIIFTMTVNDLFLRFKTFRDGEFSYKKDRGYAFEKQLNENTGFVFNKRLKDYRQPEKSGLIPMMVFTPCIINDGRRLYISSQPVSYLTANQAGERMNKTSLADGVEFGRLFKDNSADELRFSSAVRMSATFPVIMPIVTLPSEPKLDVVDAGGRDNYGMETALKFIFTFRNWISSNTSGVLIIQMRDRHKITPDEKRSNPSLMQSLVAPIESLYSNMFSVQDYQQDQLLEYASEWFDGPIDVINLQLRNEKPDKISLSWHLTRKEKVKVFESIYLPENQKAIEQIKNLIN
jgi:hypothetical protein